MTAPIPTDAERERECLCLDTDELLEWIVARHAEGTAHVVPSQLKAIIEARQRARAAALLREPMGTRVEGTATELPGGSHMVHEGDRFAGLPGYRRATLIVHEGDV